MYQGTRWVILKQKKRSRKSHAWAPLRTSQPTETEIKDVTVSRKSRFLAKAVRRHVLPMDCLPCYRFLKSKVPEVFPQQNYASAANVSEWELVQFSNSTVIQ